MRVPHAALAIFVSDLAAHPCLLPPSSGGAGSALGTQMLPVADGSDMMGSLRNPGAFNNVIGFRPSTNVISGGPTDRRGLSTSGPMGRNTEDTIQFLKTIAAVDLGSDFSPIDL